MYKRLFLSIPLTDEFINSFVDWRQNHSHLGGVRWTVPESLHITVMFLGDVRTDMIDSLADEISVETENLKPFELEFKDISLAPPGREPRMIWANFEGCEDYDKLVTNIQIAVTNFLLSRRSLPATVARERRGPLGDFDEIKRQSPLRETLPGRAGKQIPHLTLARFKFSVCLDNLIQPKLDSDILRVNKIELMESVLTSERPYYKVVEEFKLG